MITHQRHERVVAICLAALAGYADSLGFLQLGGFFVSFMSGNSTRLAVGAATNLSFALLPAALIGLFVSGVVAGSLVGHFNKTRRRRAVLLFVAFALTAAATLGTFGWNRAAVALVAIAMGAENAVFERDGEVSIGVTYMTGTLVKLGQRLTAALLGGDRWSWIWYLLLWLGLVGGALTGALVYERLGLTGLWFAAGAAVILAMAIDRVSRSNASID